MAYGTYQSIRGLMFPGGPMFSKKNIEDTLDYVPHDGDIIIASYPKTGTTWLEYIVLQIVSKGELYPDFDEISLKYIPFLEMMGVTVLDQIGNPRICMHHCPYNMVQKNNKAKYLYAYRRPEDTVISYYHFLKNINSIPPGFEEFFERFLSGNIGYGNYFDHVLSFHEHKNDENMLFVCYEKLQLNRRDEILRIAKFLGEEYHQSLIEDEALLENILERTSFDYMKKNLSLTHPKSEKEGERKTVNFFRKGVIGDGEKSLSAEQQERLKDMAKKKLQGVYEKGKSQRYMRDSMDLLRTATVGSDVVQSGRPIFDDFFQHLWPYIGNNTANIVFQMIKRLWLIRIDQ
ncbi:hypothetical protein TNCV_159161 [Trichonephila clavipes]|uniref:Sulfotransferase domain-containing protein n=1 Tax=Trichonephila clavipes TaxID=2585209 RepID=A0A8X6RAB0_TRICX|nr:hypothetical protein TNCV_159161 [Trichonephila clavipes]